MNQLDQVRLEKHKEYRRQTWLPQFFEKYSKYFDPKTKALKVISKFVNQYVLPPVINQEHLEYIPGLYRVRLRFTDENIYPPVIQKQENNTKSNTKDNKKKKDNNSSDNESSYSTAPHMHDEVFFEDNPIEADMNQVMKESLKEYNTTTLDQVITESIKDNHEVDYDEYILNQAILESLNANSNNNYDISLNNQDNQDNSVVTNNTNQLFYYVVDIRGYITDLTQPIIVYGDTYYLSNKQIDYMQKLWQKLNPETSTGLKFQQDFEFYKGLAKDSKIN